MTQLALTKLAPETIEKLALAGDVSGLSRDEKIKYYVALCERVGLDPTTQPFKLLKLQGKEVFYCDRGGCQQLSRVHGVSHSVVAREVVNECYVVTARASTKDRQSESIGAVPIKGLQGEALCNAMMKGETKAKRRATLDLLGLGMLDETEVGTIPGATTEAVNQPVARLEQPKQLEAPLTPKSPSKAATGTPAPAKTSDLLPKEATEATRTWFLDQLVNYESAAVLSYMREINWLLPTETFADIPLKFIPTTKDALRIWMGQFEQWRDGDVAPETPKKKKLDLPDSRERVQGLIEKVSVKQGQSKRGPWTSFGIAIDGKWYNTFDKKIGELAQASEGQDVILFYEEGERGNNALEIKSTSEGEPF